MVVPGPEPGIQGNRHGANDPGSPGSSRAMTVAFAASPIAQSKPTFINAITAD
jgi:hypothetical protein